MIDYDVLQSRMSEDMPVILKSLSDIPAPLSFEWCRPKNGFTLDIAGTPLICGESGIGDHEGFVRARHPEYFDDECAFLNAWGEREVRNPRTEKILIPRGDAIEGKNASFPAYTTEKYALHRKEAAILLARLRRADARNDEDVLKLARDYGGLRWRKVENGWLLVDSLWDWRMLVARVSECLNLLDEGKDMGGRFRLEEGVWRYGKGGYRLSNNPLSEKASRMAAATVVMWFPLRTCRILHEVVFVEETGRVMERTTPRDLYSYIWGLVRGCLMGGKETALHPCSNPDCPNGYGTRRTMRKTERDGAVTYECYSCVKTREKREAREREALEEGRNPPKRPGRRSKFLGEAPKAIE